MAGNISMSFDIDEDDYGEFIATLREALTDTTSHNVSVLIPQSAPLSWLDLRLIFGNRTIILRFERNTLYVRGYSRNNGNNFWEFSDSTLISGSQRLAYSGSYVESNGMGRIAGVDRENLPLGRQPLQNAISNLADIQNPNTNQHVPTRALLTLVQMFAEAARIRLISDHISQYWWEPRPLPSVMVRAQNAWETFSSSMQRSDTIWTNNTPLPNVPNPNWVNIWTIGQAIAAFGILMRLQTRSQRKKRDVTQSSSNTTSYVRTIVSIDYIRVNNIDGENPGQLYGTVLVTDSWGQHVVYNRSSDNTEDKGPGQYATLTGPKTAISGEDAFIISVSLKDHDKLSPDDEIAEGEIVWDPRNQNLSYNIPLQEVVHGKYGNVTVGYSVITEALSATIDVILINGDGESPADVFGTIKVNQHLGGSLIPLFDRSSGEYVQVYPQKSIPLVRSNLPAPTDNYLTVTTDLWDYDTLSPNDAIAQGDVQFIPSVGTQKKNIKGQYGEVQVSVTFQ